MLVSVTPALAEGAKPNYVAGFVYFASYTYFTSTYFPNMPSAGSCAGEEFAAFAGMGILSSYLLLFISFYLATYRKTGKGDKAAAKKAAAQLKNKQVPSLAAVGDSMPNGNGHIKTNGHAMSTGRNSPVTRSRKA